jgi:hypothetical protein
MKFHNTSGNKAASHNTKTSSPFEKQLHRHGNDHGNVPTPGKEHGNVPEKVSASSEAVPSHGNVPHAGKHQMEFSYITSPPVPIEPLVTKKTLADHYGLSVRTVNYAMTLGLPKVQIGGRIRFRFSETQPWFEKNGCVRFATEGIKLAIKKSLAKQFHLDLSDQVQITVTKPKPPITQKKKSV